MFGVDRVGPDKYDYKVAVLKPEPGAQGYGGVSEEA
jgi:hypothetical protein